jgi:sensory rhodopsin
MNTLAASEVSLALNAGLSVEGITMYLFWIGTVAMGAGTLYFWLMAGNVPKSYRSVMVVAGIITAVACFHYYRMGGLYIEQVAALFDPLTGQRIAGKEIGQFPTAYRYIDWIITVPLLVLEVPLLLNLGKRGRGLFRTLVGASLFMLITAWIAEESPLGGGAWWGFYIVSCLAWLYIVFVLFTQVNEQMKTQPPSIVASLKTIRMFILVGWTIYPVGFLMALAGPEGESIREICYNVADVINKVFFGLVCYQGVKALAESDGHAANPEDYIVKNPAS